MLTLDAVVHPRAVKPVLSARGRFQAIEELLDLLVSCHDLPMSRLGAAREAVFRNERRAASGVPSGAAFPYAVLDGLAAPLAAVGVAKAGIDFGTRPESKVVMLLLYPPGTYAEGHKSIPAISERLAGDTATVNALSELTTSKDLAKKLFELK